MTSLILASTSKYRRELLSRLGIAFESRAPVCDEESFKQKNLKPQELAQTLAFEKAKSLATNENCVIGGDQVLAFQDKIYGKSHTREKAIAQLLELQGQEHQLITAVCLIHHGKRIDICHVNQMKMRPLTEAQIEFYIDQEQPFDCAGSYKIESFGIRLFESVQAEDFTAIQGLPLIAVTNQLLKLGFKFPEGPLK